MPSRVPEPDAGGNGGAACRPQVLDQGPGVGLLRVFVESVELGRPPLLWCLSASLVIT